MESRLQLRTVIWFIAFYHLSTINATTILAEISTGGSIFSEKFFAQLEL
jgi:hypothetical protein